MKDIGNIKLFSLFGLFLASFGWLALLLAFLGIFYTSIIIIFAILFLGFFGYLVFLNRKNFHFNKKHFILVGLFLLAIVIFSYYSTPSVFSGRDQGSLSGAAISLSKNHSLKSSFPAELQFFKIYGPGEALNFPGFSYDQNGNLITHFPSGYISYLAAFYSIFGILGFILANAVFFFLFLFSFYAVSRNYLKYPQALALLILTLSSFIFSWIFKYTLSENLALALIWFGIAQFILFMDSRDRLHFYSFLASFGFLLFVRIETIALLIVAIIILFLSFKNNKKLFVKIISRNSLLAIGAIMAIFIASLKINSAFYVTFAKGFLNSVNLENNAAQSSGFFSGVFYVFRVLSAYALFTYVILGISALIYFLKKKNYKILIPFFILLPAFVYLFIPSITLDHPWMLRRYVFAVIPASILYSMIFLIHFIKKEKYFYILSLFLFLTNLMVFVPYINVNENKNLLNETRDLSSNFQENDLILIDRLASGDPWAMIASPMNLLFGKQAVYFFNPKDLQKLDLQKFERTYFIIPDNNIEFYRSSGIISRLIPVKDYVIKNQSLGIITGTKEQLLKNPISLPVYERNYIYGKIYLLK